jgi:hypothetical protein
MRVEHEYERDGAVAYRAAYDVHPGQVFSRDARVGLANVGRGPPAGCTPPGIRCIRRAGDVCHRDL